MTAEPGDVLWQPDADRIERSELTRFARWARDSGAADDADIADYAALWHWSIRDLDRFWRSRGRLLRRRGRHAGGPVGGAGCHARRQRGSPGRP